MLKKRGDRTKRDGTIRGASGLAMTPTANYRGGSDQKLGEAKGEDSSIVKGREELSNLRRMRKDGLATSGGGSDIDAKARPKKKSYRAHPR